MSCLQNPDTWGWRQTSTLLILKATLGPKGLIKSCAWISLFNFWALFHLPSKPFWSWVDAPEWLEPPSTPYWFYFHPFSFHVNQNLTWKAILPFADFLSSFAPFSFLFHTASDLITSSSSVLTVRCPWYPITRNRMEWKERNNFWCLRQVYSHHPVWKCRAPLFARWEEPRSYISALPTKSAWHPLVLDWICSLGWVTCSLKHDIQAFPLFCLPAHQIKTIHWQIWKRYSMLASHMLLGHAGPLSAECGSSFCSFSRCPLGFLLHLHRHVSVCFHSSGWEASPLDWVRDQMSFSGKCSVFCLVVRRCTLGAELTCKCIFIF